MQSAPLNDDRAYVITTRFYSAIFIGAALLLSACGPRAATAPTPVPAPAPAPIEPAPPPVVEKAPVPESSPALPPIPLETGPLAIKIIYPDSGQLIQSKDSNFIFGSIGNGEAGLTINGVLTPVWPNGAFMGWLPNPPADNPVYEIVATTGVDTVRVSHRVKIAVPPVGPVAPPDTMIPMTGERYAQLIGPASYASDTDRVITGYAPEGGVERWFLAPNTVLKVVSTKGTDAYVMPDSTQTLRIEKAEYKLLDSGTKVVHPRAAAFTVKNSGQWTDFVIPLNAQPAYLVAESASTLKLILYGTGGARRSQGPVKPGSTSYVTSASAKAVGPQMQYTFALKGPIYGYQPIWESGKLTFRIRKPPTIDPASPLMGLTIAVDPGHPPIGATGPTGLWEPVPTLEVGFKIRELLQAKGVNVLMTRSTADPVDLNLRGTLARRGNANALVSIHLNALPDGINPFRAQGTETYHYHLHSGPLAETVQKTAVANLGLPDNGAKRRNLALVRPTWMPAILVEGAFIMMPDQEAAMRTPEYQEKYAKGIVDGLENYFRALAATQQVTR